MRKIKPVSRDSEPTVGRRQFIRASVGGAVAAGGVAASAEPVAADPYDGWLDDVDNYDGTVDLRERDEVRVEVGAGEDGLLFDPPAILVDPGTAVVWEWTGEGGAHDVTTVEGPAELGSELVGDAGHSYEHTFETDHEGITTYVCTPHEAVDMKGTVAVGVDIPGDDLIDPNDAEDGSSDEATATTRSLSGLDMIVTAIALGMVGVLVLLPFYNTTDADERR